MSDRVIDHLKPFRAYIICVIASSICGFILGSYEWHGQLYFSEGYSGVGRYIYQPVIRSLLEILILFFQLIYYVILAPVFIRKREDVDFFFKLILFAGFIHFFLGLCAMMFPDYIFIARHWIDGRGIGWRFHGIAGEPRDAFVFGFFFYMLLLLRGLLYTKKVHMYRLWLLAIIISSVLTKSFSGVVGLSLSIMVYSYFKGVRAALPLCFVGVIMIPSIIIYDSRHHIYFDEILKYINHGSIFDHIPYYVYAQISNVLPLVVYFQDCITFQWFNVLFGHGIGTAPFLLSHIYSKYSLPNAQIVRELFDVGLVGLLCWINAIYHVFYQSIKTWSQY